MALADDLLAVLDDPTHMWSHALKELSIDAQRLFLTLTLLPKPVSSDILQIAYTSQTPNRSESFLDSLRALEDSFITIEKRYAELRSVSFRNPSLQDFANVYLDGNSDWLDSLLSTPSYYEQIIITFSMAMAQTALLVSPRDKSQKSAPPKYPGVKAWVERRAAGLIEMAINLLGAERAEIYVDVRKSRLGQLLEIMAIYGMPSKVELSGKLRAAATVAVHPGRRDSADIMVELLSKPTYRKLLDDILGDNAAVVMRESVLDKDSWKFAVLAEVDQLLELDPQETWDSWGNDYVHYARQLAGDLVNSDDDDDLRVAINELNAIGEMLGTDFYDEIAALEQRRSKLPRDDDYDDDSSRSLKSVSSVDKSAQLDQIFASLL